MKIVLAMLASLMLAGCVMLTEDGQKIVTEASEILLAPFSLNAPLTLVTEAGDPFTAEDATRLLAEVPSKLLATEAGDIITDEFSNPLETEFL